MGLCVEPQSASQAPGIQELRRVGLKVTVPRLRIWGILVQANPRHMSAEDVYRSLLEVGEEVGIATVYRVLTQFEAVDLLKRHYFEERGQSVFEINSGEHHDHLVCTECNAVEEFLDELLEARQTIVAQKAGFQLVEHNLTLYGVCARCQK